MRAAVYRTYGPADVVKVEDVEQPSVGDADRVLIRVHYASVNPLDNHLRTGLPWVRLFRSGPKKPHIPGVDVAGVVEAVGQGVTKFKVGDRVFGSCYGAMAEYTRPRQTSLSHVPDHVSLKAAAAIPCVGLTALQALRDVAPVKPGHKVLVYGASGGIGHMGVQIAKAFGAEVTAVTSTPNLPWVKELGPDHLIDYTKEDFARNGRQYDIILDAVGKRTFYGCLGSLTDSGIYVSEFFLNTWYHPFQLLLSSWVGRKKGKFHLAKPTEPDMETLGRLLDEGKIRPHIEQCYPLEQAAEAHRHLKTGRAKGKLLVEVKPE